MTPEKKLLLEKVREVELLSAASRALNANVEFGERLRTLLKIVRTALRAESVLLAMVDAAGRLVFERAIGPRDDAVRGAVIAPGEGIMGWVLAHAEPLFIDDARHRSEPALTLEKKLGLKPHAIAAVPIVRRGRVVGVLEVVDRKRGGAFGEGNLTLLVPLGEHVAVAVANARLRERAERRELEYSLLAEVSADVGKSLTLDEALQKILKNLKRLVPYDAAAIFLLDRKSNTISSELHTGYPRGAEEKIRIQMGEGLVGLAASTKTGIIVGDVRKHPSYVDVRGRTRSEMVAPMILRGQVLGGFNVESDRLNAYTEDDLRLLESFASQAAVAIDRAHLYEERRVKLELEEEMRLARTVQDFFAPKKSLKTGGFKIAGANFPSLEVSGDYYDFFRSRNRMVAFAIADVAGKGFPASLITSSLRATLHTVAPYLVSARQITVRSNQILLETVRPQDFVTAFIAVLDPDTGEVSYCNAGHNPPILMRPDGSYRTLEAGGTVLGVLEDGQWAEGRLRFTDEVLVCYTDGATESRNAEDQEYGEARFIETLRANLSLSPYRLCNALHASVRAFIGAAKTTDDVTYLVVKRVDRGAVTAGTAGPAGSSSSESE